MAAVESYAILNDVHFPFEDRRRYEIALEIFKAQPTLKHIYLNGDIAEFQGVSAHPIHPSEKGINFSTELVYVNKRFDELMEMFPGMPVTYIVGNHEHRFFRYVRDIAPAIWGVIDCPELLKFPERPLWRLVDYGPTQLVRCGKSNLWLRHEPLGSGKNHAGLTAEKSIVDLAYGHTHVYQAAMHRKFGPGHVHTKAYSLGWLGDKSRHVFDYRGAKDNWALGCTIVEADVLTGEYTLEFISLERLPVLFRGRHYGEIEEGKGSGNVGGGVPSDHANG